MEKLYVCEECGQDGPRDCYCGLQPSPLEFITAVCISIGCGVLAWGGLNALLQWVLR